jgi:hypothetical protein
MAKKEPCPLAKVCPIIKNGGIECEPPYADCATLIAYQKGELKID